MKNKKCQVCGGLILSKDLKSKKQGKLTKVKKRFSNLTEMSLLARFPEGRDLKDTSMVDETWTENDDRKLLCQDCLKDIDAKRV